MNKSVNEKGTLIIQLESWDEFISLIRNIKYLSIRIFRGQRDINWELSSK